MAVIASSYANEKLLLDKKQRETQKIKELAEAKRLKKSLETAPLLFKLKVGEQGKLFGTISNKQIAGALLEKGYEIDKKAIEIPHHISSIGQYTVKINLPQRVIAKLIILVEEE